VTGLEQAAAEVAAEGARTHHQVAHFESPLICPEL
jgi:hypothetical protein